MNTVHKILALVSKGYQVSDDALNGGVLIWKAGDYRGHTVHSFVEPATLVNAAETASLYANWPESVAHAKTLKRILRMVG